MTFNPSPSAHPLLLITYRILAPITWSCSLCIRCPRLTTAVPWNITVVVILWMQDVSITIVMIIASSAITTTVVVVGHIRWIRINPLLLLLLLIQHIPPVRTILVRISTATTATAQPPSAGPTYPLVCLLLLLPLVPTGWRSRLLPELGRVLVEVAHLERLGLFLVRLELALLHHCHVHRGLDLH